MKLDDFGLQEDFHWISSTHSPRIVTLCGSTRFRSEFEEANKILTHGGYVVLTVGSFAHAVHGQDKEEVWGSEVAERLELRRHLGLAGVER